MSFSSSQAEVLTKAQSMSQGFSRDSRILFETRADQTCERSSTKPSVMTSLAMCNSPALGFGKQVVKRAVKDPTGSDIGSASLDAHRDASLIGGLLGRLRDLLAINLLGAKDESAVSVLGNAHEIVPRGLLHLARSVSEHCCRVDGIHSCSSLWPVLYID